jgi:hypothetical protein
MQGTLLITTNSVFPWLGASRVALLHSEQCSTIVSYDLLQYSTIPDPSKAKLPSISSTTMISVGQKSWKALLSWQYFGVTRLYSLSGTFSSIQLHLLFPAHACKLQTSISFAYPAIERVQTPVAHCHTTQTTQIMSLRACK